MSSRVSRRFMMLARRAVLASLIASVSTASAQVVELKTTPIEKSGRPSPLRLAQTQARTQIQAPAPPAAPTSTPNAAANAAPPTPRAQDPNGIPEVAPELNVDPNARIDELVPPAVPSETETVPLPVPVPVPAASALAPANVNATRQAGLGATAGAFSAAPNMIGDLFGGGLSSFGGSQQVFFSGHSAGTILSGGPGQANSVLAFEFGGDFVPDDIFTSGLGQDLAGNDGQADTFAISEPLPPNGALTSPGPGFVFDGGTAVYAGGNADLPATTAQPGQFQNGDPWFVSYSYSSTLLGPDEGGRPIPSPGVAVRRIKLSENFSPEVRDRCFGSYNFFNDAFGGLGDVSRYTLGAEKILVDRLISVEARMLMAGTYGSTQVLELPESRDFELGNAGFVGKGVLLRGDRYLWSAGLGVTVPVADDTIVRRGGQDILVIKNRSVHLLPFTALMLRASRDTFLQAYMQVDVAASGDPLYGNLAGGPLPKLGVFTDSTLMELDFALNHVLHRSRTRSLVRQVIANTELHYTGSLQESDFVTSNGLTYTNLSRYFNVVNATGGLHLVLSNNLIVTPAMSIPLRDGFDEQFDYEAIVQVNYLH